VQPEALAFAFDVVTAGTMADGATLGVESVPVGQGRPVLQIPHHHADAAKPQAAVYRPGNNPFSLPCPDRLVYGSYGPGS
jgi:hypothetical protein